MITDSKLKQKWDKLKKATHKGVCVPTQFIIIVFYCIKGQWTFITVQKTNGYKHANHQHIINHARKQLAIPLFYLDWGDSNIYIMKIIWRKNSLEILIAEPFAHIKKGKVIQFLFIWLAFYMCKSMIFLDY